MLHWLGNDFIKVNYKNLKKLIVISFIGFVSFCLILLVLDRFYFSRKYNFQIDEISFSVFSDECQFCFLDSQFEHTILLTNVQSNLKNTFKMFSESPKLSFSKSSKSNEFYILGKNEQSLTIDCNNLKENNNKLDCKSDMRIYFLINEVQKLKTFSTKDSLSQKDKILLYK